MKVILLCNEAANQRALACRLASVLDLAAIALVRPVPSNSDRRLARISRGVAGYPLRRAWHALFDSYDKQYPEYPDVPRSQHVGVNSDSVRSLIDTLQPDLVMISGTDLLRPPLIQQMSKFGKVINLHTGISPYIRGGPNCTNWALAINRPDLIGNTVMWLDAGVDSGNLIATERTCLSGEETLFEVHRQVMDHAHDLYCRVAMRIVEGQAVPSVVQSTLGAGLMFRSKEWTAAAALRTLWGFYHGFNAATLSARGNEVLVALSSSSREPTDL